MIAYLAPHLDISGGVKTLATHVGMLRGRGIDARLVNCGEARAPWCRTVESLAPHTISLHRFLEDHDGPENIVVVPETIAWMGLGLKGRRILLILSWFYAEFFLRKLYTYRDGVAVETALSRKFRPVLTGNPVNGALRGLLMRRNVRRYGFEAIFTNSEYTQEWAKRRLSYAPFVIPTGIDADVFYEDPGARVANRILMIRRSGLTEKRGGEVDGVYDELAEDSVLDPVLVGGLSEHEMAREYRRADLFLVFGRYEGFPRTVLEAMRCGCVVVGYDGGGGRETMLHGHTAMVAHDRDEIVRYVRELTEDPERKERIRLGGREMGARYTLERQAASLLAGFEALEKASSAGRCSLKTNLHGYM